MDLFTQMQQLFHPNGVVWTDPTTSYGPSQSRYTRTPINFVNGGNPNQAGEYTGTGGVGQITINPTVAANKGGVGTVIKHESIHALLDRLPDAIQQSLPQGLPGYQDVANALSPIVTGNMAYEAPAYMGSSKQGYLGLPQTKQEQFTQALTDHLNRNYPDIGKIFQQIIGNAR
jgi:hypothetical protein